jgi:hypothetical protein
MSIIWRKKRAFVPAGSIEYANELGKIDPGENFAKEKSPSGDPV